MQRAMIAWVFLCAAIPASGVCVVAQGQETSTAQQAANAAPSERIRVGGNMAVSNLIHKVDPVYPAIAKAAKIQGTVVLQAVISKDGSIENLHLISGHPMLAPAAIDAVKQWKYKPYFLNGEPVEVETTINVNFTLAGG